MSRASKKANRESSVRAHNASHKADKDKQYFQSNSSSKCKNELLQKLKEQKGL